MSNDERARRRPSLHGVSVHRNVLACLHLLALASPSTAYRIESEHHRERASLSRFDWTRFLPMAWKTDPDVANDVVSQDARLVNPQTHGHAFRAAQWRVDEMQASELAGASRQEGIASSLINTVSKLGSRTRADDEKGYTMKQKVQITVVVLLVSGVLWFLISIYEKLEAMISQAAAQQGEDRTARAEAQAQATAASSAAADKAAQDAIANARADDEANDANCFNFIAVCNIQRKAILVARGLDGNKPRQPEAKTTLKKLLVAAEKKMKASTLKILKDSTFSMAYMVSRDKVYMTVFGGILQTEYPTSIMEQCVMEVMSAINEFNDKDKWSEIQWEQKLGSMLHEKNNIYKDPKKAAGCSGAFGSTLDTMSALNASMQEQTRKVQKNQHAMVQLNQTSAQMSDEAQHMNNLSEIAKRKHELEATKQMLQMAIMIADGIILYMVWNQ
eukprot:TRINITY_DN14945_c1_g3_i1.p1 TRINITY_DN14945_c1_g3~~TRINITY_DN14945_c1_g3_i1.p1  ORF type:complete len:484 (+),score=92.14 TRINITY_DN14945_c1_g3_i1:116-1453(+)